RLQHAQNPRDSSVDAVAHRARHQHALHMPRRLRQVSRAAAGHHQRQAGHTRRRLHGHVLRNHAAHGGTAHVSPGNAQCIEHAQGVLGHVTQRVGAAHRQPQGVAQT
ncbi:hypothetical protein RZS08_44620, partial [Arthrospira platensis SPKY1]|nr:hypothetical protein [Arthrospira platensis SPKY1]